MTFDECMADGLCMAVLDVKEAVEDFGAAEIWRQLRAAYPSQYNQLLYYALEQLPK